MYTVKFRGREENLPLRPKKEGKKNLNDYLLKSDSSEFHEPMYSVSLNRKLRKHAGSGLSKKLLSL